MNKKSKVCPRCKGLGSEVKIVKIKKDNGNFVETTEEIACRKCNGTGIIIKGK